MKTIITLCIIILFTFNPSYCQFQKEAEYISKNVTRVLLQNQLERYFYFDYETYEIKVADASHQVINSIPTPCDADFGIRTVRSDMNNIDLGLFCTCANSSTQNGDYILDQDGNIIKEFDSRPIFINDHHIVVFDEEDYHTYIYDTRSLELIKEMPQMHLQAGFKSYNDGDYYYGNNGVDSIFVFDTSLSKIRELSFDFIDKTKIRLTMASKLENNEPSFYFLASEFNKYRTLIDEKGIILHEFDDIISFFTLFHKYEQKLQVAINHDGGVSTYDVDEKQIFEVIPTSSAPVTVVNGGKYIAIKYDPNTTIAEFYNYKRELEIVVGLYDSNYYAGPWPFTDHLGNEYFRYLQRNGDGYNDVIYKNNEYLQTLENSFFLIPNNIESLDTKLIYYPEDKNYVEIYGIKTTSTEDIPKSTFSISPNPAKDVLTISGDVENGAYTIYDVAGKLIQRGFVDNDQFSIDVSELNLGMYFIKMSKKDKSYEVNKFIKG